MQKAGSRVRRKSVPKAAPIGVYLDSYFDQTTRGAWPLSIAQTVRSLRLQAPPCDLTDGELSDLIAIRAVERGYSVVFDADLLA